MKPYIPVIGGFTDFITHHSDGTPFLVSKTPFSLVASFDLATMLESKYRFTDKSAYEATLRGIRANWHYMFEIEESNNFFWPNMNMFSPGNAETGLSGYVVTIKPQYRAR